MTDAQSLALAPSQALQRAFSSCSVMHWAGIWVRRTEALGAASHTVARAAAAER